jgi:hypothetical protein
MARRILSSSHPGVSRYCCELKLVQARDGISLNIGFCHANSACFRKCCAALNPIPQECPSDARRVIASAMPASETFDCTAPAVA